MSNHSFITQALKESLAVIMAGGKGTRLKDLTTAQSKPAVHFGGKFRIIDFTVSNCLNSNIRKMMVLTQYRAHSLIQHLHQTWGFLNPQFGEGVEIVPAQQQTDEECWYKGTADAVYQNIEYIKKHKPKYIFVLAGDHVYKEDYSIILEEHIARGAKATVVCLEAPSHVAANTYGVMGINKNELVTSFIEKPAEPEEMPGKPGWTLASMGIYLFDADFLIDILEKDAVDKDSSHDFGKNILPKLVKKGELYAHLFSKSCVYSHLQLPYWKDVGNIDSYFESNIDLTYPVPPFDIFDPKWPIWTHQEQLPPAKFVYETEYRTGMAVKSMISEGCIISGATIRRSMLFTNVKVHSFTLIEDSLILPNCTIGRNVKIKRAIIAEGCDIPRDMLVGYDPAFDKKYFHISEGGIVLVTPDMLKKIPHEKTLFTHQF